MGLELSLARLKALAKFAFGMGLTQVSLGCKLRMPDFFLSNEEDLQMAHMVCHLSIYGNRLNDSML